MCQGVGEDRDAPSAPKNQAADAGRAEVQVKVNPAEVSLWADAACVVQRLFACALVVQSSTCLVYGLMSSKCKGR